MIPVKNSACIIRGELFIKKAICFDGDIRLMQVVSIIVSCLLLLFRNKKPLIAMIQCRLVTDWAVSFLLARISVFVIIFRKATQQDASIFLLLIGQNHDTCPPYISPIFSGNFGYNTTWELSSHSSLFIFFEVDWLNQTYI